MLLSCIYLVAVILASKVLYCFSVSYPINDVNDFRTVCYHKRTLNECPVRQRSRAPLLNGQRRLLDSEGWTWQKGQNQVFIVLRKPGEKNPHQEPDTDRSQTRENGGQSMSSI